VFAYDYQAPRSAAARPVWIVDDDRSIRWVLEKALEREGIPYKTFSSAFEVLQALAVDEPQVLVTDVRMPGESGLALLAKVKERCPHLPVIVMTAYSDLDSAVAGFVDHYNHRRYHESLDNIAPSDVYFGRAARILRRREEIKRRTIEQRRRQHFNAAA